ncbi:Ion transport 2 domain protein [Desulfamplus magnetovallimortis]|uniref:Ion transport 2 domain protein n=1 Tax=Desulfamplus magnetovallimortis TaxID=1246637 RepID=A0A1W1H602_9BACT|nr:potassium channel family protein [Desulfamplus magnetovallimortis]SLM27866.1 Ion transport 2 domain protein [Desulfamplus magnetovallimortis]
MTSDNIRIKIYSTIFSILLVSGTAGFMIFEKLSLVDALYFSIVTMATVGYGDIHPQTHIGKILSLFMIVGGVGTFLGVVASITDLFVNRREELQRHEKLNMVTGLFFSEMGNRLLNSLSRLDPNIKELNTLLHISGEWSESTFTSAFKTVKLHKFEIDSLLPYDFPSDSSGNESPNYPFLEINEYLQHKRNLLLRLIENPIIQEHETFTELLRAVFHLRDELINRPDIKVLLPTDRKHLEGDAIRIYRLLTLEWLRYMHYLSKNYGYLFSLAVRTSPFNPEANPVVTQ